MTLRTRPPLFAVHVEKVEEPGKDTITYHIRTDCISESLDTHKSPIATIVME